MNTPKRPKRRIFPAARPARPDYPPSPSDPPKPARFAAVPVQNRAGPPPGGPPPVEPSPAEYQPQPPNWSAAARFPSPRAALGHVAATADLGPPGLRRSPHDNAVWALLGPGHRPGIPLVAGYGGTVYQADADGVLWPEDRSAPGTLPAGRITAVVGWDVVTLAELAGHSPVGAPPPGLREIAVLAPGALARWLLRRALATGVHTTFTPVERLGPDGRTDTGWLLLQLHATDGAVPAGLVEACGRLPGTVAGRPADPDCRVLIDLRLQLPLDDALLLDEQADGHHVVVECATVGPPWRWRPLGKPAAGALLDAGPVLSTAEPERTPVPVPALGPPLPVRLVPSPRAPNRVDAVLISDAELDGLRRFLRSRPLHETAVVAFGPGRHLVTEPPGLLESLPFGICVYQAGPGALYLESGCVLSPPLPDPAREEVLGLGGDVIKVLCRDGAWELRFDEVRPAWHLWVPRAPVFATGVSQSARELLGRLAGLVPEPEPSAPAAVRTPETERRRLNQAAMEHSLRGEYREAAELLEQAGHFQRAAQLYERAAAQLDEAQ